MRHQAKDALQAITLAGAVLLGAEAINTAEAAAPPTSAAFRARGLIERLGADEWADREEASRALKALVLDDDTGPKVFPLVKEAAKSPDLEVRRRAGRLLSAYYAVQPTTFLVTPWIDSLPSGDPRISAYLEKARVQNGGHIACGPDYFTHREATRLMVRDMLDDGKSPREIRKLLDQMAEGDREQVRTKLNHRLANGLMEK